MQRKMLRAKIHRATVTHADPDYVGSITIDALLLAEADIRPNEAVNIYNITNANRFETYVIKGEPGSGVIGVNGAAAKLVSLGDHLIICAYAMYEDAELQGHSAHIVLCKDDNSIAEILDYSSDLNDPAAVH